MYNVSESYLSKMFDQIQTHKLIGYIDDVSFDDGDVIGISYTNRCAEKKVALGSVNIGTLKLTFLRDVLNRGEYFGKTIALFDSLYLGLDENEEPIWESVPIGTFYIAEAVWNAAGIDITAYDCLSKLDKTINIDETSSKIYGFCQYIATETDTVFGMTEEECDELPNGTEIIAPYEEANFETFRDLLSALAQMVGGFAYAAKDGTWKLKPFDDSSVLTIPRNRRMTGSTFSDFETYYDTVLFTDVEAKMVRSIGDGEGLSMNLGPQPFLQYGVWEARERRAQAIVDSILRMTYTPFKITLLPAFIALDLGDVITMTDDFSGDSSTGAVMEFSWTYNKSLAVHCYGDNPALQSAQSKTEKNIVGLINSTTQNEVTYYNYTNLDPIEFGSDEEITIASLGFTAAQTTTVKIMHEFLLDIVKDLTVNGGYEIHYYLDNELVTYKPRESLTAIQGSVTLPPPEEEEEGEVLPVDIEPVDLSITRDFFYVIRNVTPNIRHIWEVTITAHGIDSVTIGEQNAHITLEGQRLYGEEHFDGTIEVRENIGKVSLVGMGVKDASELVDFEMEEDEVIDLSDNIAVIDLVGLGVDGMTEAIQIVQTWLPLASETHLVFKTEDGLIIKTEE